MPLLFATLLFAPVPFGPADGAVEVRDEIVASYQRSLDALARGDAGSAVRIDTDDWVSFTPGERPLARRERDAYLRQDMRSLPRDGWRSGNPITRITAPQPAFRFTM